MTNPPKIDHPDRLPVNSAIVTYRRQRRIRSILLFAALLALLLSILLLYRANAAGPLPPPDPATQTYYTCRYIRRCHTYCGCTSNSNRPTNQYGCM